MTEEPPPPDPDATVAGPAPAMPQDPLCGSRLGAFHVERTIGSGGMGRVYEARVAEKASGVDIGTRVALKVIHPQLLAEPGFFKRFIREGNIGRSVHHTNVVRTYDCDQVMLNGRPCSFLVMELVEGQTLSDLKDELEAVPEELCRHIGREVARGLSAIHNAKVVHRDIKPENVLITPNHEIKIMDLGIARLQEEAVRISQTGHFVGSLRYAAPEQFSEHRDAVGSATDLHALGVLLYELASGRPPYGGADTRQLIQAITSEKPRRLGDANPQISSFFEELVHTLLEKAPEDRFVDAEALLEVLTIGEASHWWQSRVADVQAKARQQLRRVRVPRDSAVHGRDDVLSRLQALYKSAESGNGQVVLLEGEAGIGKSRTIDELVTRVHDTGAPFHFLWGSYPPAGAATAVGAFSEAFHSHVGKRGSRDLLLEVPLLAPAFDALLRGEPPPAEGGGALTKDSLQTCFVHAIRELSRQRTTVLFVDDLHFAPEEGLGLFASLALAVPDHRILLVGSFRPGTLNDDWLAEVQRQERVSRIELQRLGPRDLIQLLEDALGSSRLAEELSGKIAVKSDGNPFFVFEILRGLREGKFLTKKPDGTWISTKAIVDIEIPSSVLDLVNARVSDLHEDDRHILDVAACLGYEFDPLLVGRVLGLANIPLLRRLSQLERRHRLVRSSGPRFSFDHHQVQEALYGSIPELLRREYHAALAESLEAHSNALETSPEELDGPLCLDLCHHFFEGDQGSRAKRYLERSRSHLVSTHRYAEDVALAERALATPQLLAGKERAQLLLGISRSLDVVGHFAQRVAYAVEAEKTASELGDTRLLGEAAIAHGSALAKQARWEDAMAKSRDAIDIFVSVGVEEGEAKARAQLGSILRWVGEVDEARSQLERAFDLSTGTGTAAERTTVSNLAALYHIQSQWQPAVEWNEKCLELALESNDAQTEIYARGALVILLDRVGRTEDGWEHAKRALARSQEIGDRQCEQTILNNIGLKLSQQAKFASARDHFNPALTLCRELGLQIAEGLVLANLGLIAFHLGDISQASDLLATSMDKKHATGSRHYMVATLRLLGNLAVERGEIREAREKLEEAIALAREVRDPDGEVQAMVELAEVFIWNDDPESAKPFLDDALELGGEPEILALIRILLARLPGGDVAAAVEALEHLDRQQYFPKLHFLLWEVSRDATHLEEAKRILDELIAHAPPDDRERARRNVRINREILTAWERHGN